MDFVYDKLPGPRHIRLLTLLPAAYEDPLECTIETVQLDAVVGEYGALSYSWELDQPASDLSQCDDSSSTASWNVARDVICHLTLMVNKSSVAIGQNLCDGLKRIRLPDKAVRIWIDALCINQVDNLEKTEQVALMGEIYAEAG